MSTFTTPHTSASAIPLETLEKRKQRKLHEIRQRREYKYKIKFQAFKEFGYFPHDAQRIVHESRSRFKIVVGGARFGKTMLGAAEAALQFLIPNSKVWIVATVYSLAEKEFTFALDFLSNYQVAPGISALEVCNLSNPNKGSKKLVAPWGSILETKSTEKMSTLLGDEIDLGVGGEWSQASRTPWSRCLRARLGPLEGEWIAASTGSGDTGLFADQFRMGQKKSALYNPEYESWQFSVLDNPYFDRAEYDKAQAEMNATDFDEQFKGLLVSRLGKVFSVGALSNVFTYPPRFDGWPIVFGVRGQINNPTCVAAIAVNPEGHEYIVFDQFYEQHARMNAVYDFLVKTSYGKRVLGVVGNKNETYIAKELKKFGVKVAELNEEQLSREQAESARIQLLWKLLEEKEPVLKFMSDSCPDILEEFEQVTWAESRTEKNRLEIELPLDINMTAPRAVSYAVSWLELGRNFNFYKEFANL